MPILSGAPNLWEKEIQHSVLRDGKSGEWDAAVYSSEKGIALHAAFENGQASLTVKRQQEDRIVTLSATSPNDTSLTSSLYENVPADFSAPQGGVKPLWQAVRALMQHDDHVIPPDGVKSLTEKLVDVVTAAEAALTSGPAKPRSGPAYSPPPFASNSLNAFIVV